MRLCGRRLYAVPGTEIVPLDKVRPREMESLMLPEKACGFHILFLMRSKRIRGLRVPGWLDLESSVREVRQSGAKLGWHRRSLLVIFWSLNATPADKYQTSFRWQADVQSSVMQWCDFACLQHDPKPLAIWSCSMFIEPWRLILLYYFIRFPGSVGW